MQSVYTVSCCGLWRLDVLTRGTTQGHPVPPLSGMRYGVRCCSFGPGKRGSEIRNNFKDAHLMFVAMVGGFFERLSLYYKISLTYRLGNGSIGSESRLYGKTIPMQ